VALTVVLFGVAAVAGAWLRFGLTAALNRRTIPLGTLAVNLAGSLAAGVVAARLDGDVRTIVLTGGLGAFTTYSSFAGEVRAMGHDRRAGLTVFYVALTVVGCVAAARVGLALGG
jgi:CrcB protein